ncbi:MAG: FtsQ-type POTRA domain-containing protein [Treponema sp.]|jgi:cell division protein FtsQ|nr:FtsQ-type POTRA domain-containing protein [Treponema sp.]
MVARRNGQAAVVETQGKAAKKTENKAGALKLMVFLLCIFLLLELVVYLVIVPGMGPAKIFYEGINRYVPEDLVYLLGENGTRNWFRFDARAAASALSSFTGVESVEVEKHFPDSVTIRVEERTPVAMTLATVQERMVPVMVDEAGVVFPMDIRGEDSGLPLITGLPVENRAGGMRLDKLYQPLFGQIAALRADKRQYFAALSEIHVIPKEYGTYELILYPVYGKVRVFMDRNLNEETLQYMMVALDVVNSMKPEVKEIDLRYGSVSYRTAAMDAAAITEIGGRFER